MKELAKEYTEETQKAARAAAATPFDDFWAEVEKHLEAKNDVGQRVQPK